MNPALAIDEVIDPVRAYRTVLRSSTVLSNTRLIVQIQRLPMNASGYRQ
jgi:hypothetical protein